MVLEGGPHLNPAHVPPASAGSRSSGMLSALPALGGVAGARHCFKNTPRALKRLFTRQSLGCVPGFEFDLAAKKKKRNQRMHSAVPLPFFI